MVLGRSSEEEKPIDKSCTCTIEVRDIHCAKHSKQ